ncbi:phosphatase PAP2 family protein [Streptomyces sp. NPDC006798]|uniref:phosphatase PAP2 family protein n=1 Tax=Streptomyces sp. NPDC006798 TaxID=3155462 RepID=UPI0033D13F10
MLLWAAAGAIALGFVIALEIAARHHGAPGPITTQWREAIFRPVSGPLLYASMALMMVVLSWRQRAIAFSVAVGIDVVFALVRLPFGAAQGYGNGALWVIIGVAVLAITRRTGAERTLMLKGVGLGLLLVTGRKTGDAWLLITSKTKPEVLDPYLVVADQALGSPSWVVGRMVEATGSVGHNVLDWVYVQLAVAAVCAALYQLRHVARDGRFPGHHLVRTFLVIGLLGPGIYMIFPVVGPIYAYGVEGGAFAAANVWPETLPSIGTPVPIPFDEITPRNCMPSLHTAWATAIYIHTRRSPRPLRWAGTIWLIATLAATLGFGYHYGLDLVAGVVFTLTIEAGMRALDRGWNRQVVQFVAYGTAVFAALLVSYRFLSVPMGDHPWLFGPLVLLAMASVIYAYVRLTRRWDRDAEAEAGKETETAAVPGPRTEVKADTKSKSKPKPDSEPEAEAELV